MGSPGAATRWTVVSCCRLGEREVPQQQANRDDGRKLGGEGTFSCRSGNPFVVFIGLVEE